MAGVQQFTRRGCQPCAQIAVSLQQQPESRRQQLAQRALGASRRVDGVPDRAPILCHLFDRGGEVTDEAGGQSRAIFRPQRRRQPGLAISGRRCFAEDADGDWLQRTRSPARCVLITCHETMDCRASSVTSQTLKRPSRRLHDYVWLDSKAARLEKWLGPAERSV